MTTRNEIMQACLSLPFVYADTPFPDPNWTVIRHQENQKMFAAIFQRQGKIWLNVKVNPLTGDFWRQTSPAVLPAYHMNKTHWISIILDGSLEDAVICQLIQESFALTKKQTRPKDADL